MGWDDWSEETGEPCPRCHGAGVLDEGEKGHGRCPACEGRGQRDPEDEGDAEGGLGPEGG